VTLAANPPLARRAGGFLALTKPRIVELLLVTTLPTMIVAKRGWPGWGLVLVTLIGGALAAGGANAANMIVDRDIDAVMHRTQRRPLVTGVVSVREAVAFSLGLELVAFVVLWKGVNLLSAVLALSAAAFYLGVYTLWLKRTSTQNIVIGGAAGAVPVLVGWAAVTDRLALAPLVLFAIIFFWTPPHFWSLAVRYREDYQAVDVPMLPAVASLEVTGRQIVGYTLILGACALLFAFAGHTGVVYLVAAAVLSGIFVFRAVRLARHPSAERAMRLFHWSILYLTLLFVAMAVDEFTIIDALRFRL
jgi:protoheme IX farnesyltransferase